MAKEVQIEEHSYKIDTTQLDNLRDTAIGFAELASALGVTVAAVRNWCDVGLNDARKRSPEKVLLKSFKVRGKRHTLIGDFVDFCNRAGCKSHLFQFCHSRGLIKKQNGVRIMDVGSMSSLDAEIGATESTDLVKACEQCATLASNQAKAPSLASLLNCVANEIRVLREAIDGIPSTEGASMLPRVVFDQSLARRLKRTGVRPQLIVKNDAENGERAVLMGNLDS